MRKFSLYSIDWFTNVVIFKYMNKLINNQLIRFIKIYIYKELINKLLHQLIKFYISVVLYSHTHTSMISTIVAFFLV